MNSIKLKRINAELVRVISNILLTESRDKLMQTITITGADTNNDLSLAKIYFTSLLDNYSKEDLEKEMNEASGFIRKLVASKINLRQTPELKFVYDTSIQYGNNIEKKIDELHK